MSETHRYVRRHPVTYTTVRAPMLVAINAPEPWWHQPLREALVYGGFLAALVVFLLVVEVS